ncbi:MAG TPA: biopolymer transporter ExbD [Polyangiaceae bacterium LLY-WYZ-15_(1-7)]|nr:hypothetical protein [Sandaracinus sp.]HJK90471.1 biopolymer transporter ExbD [Polyangiaceae bacterium LLY-WYZ-15_(1-7)]MBJ71311.1 hypothetical protein [Sandaracinus sp.]HJL02275.1 biopolymer transporter ExbD [Polyangiaceae bacterium LLY-WYZ-15_(1-7)]HJL09305.1 biopolymer transporter ExbD [Polyangiaceae bacterium LLY-WYZ-15_(1-7)]
MRSRFLKPQKAPGLMLTSLLDMFTIILIFLIVSFDAESYDFRLAEDVTLPESATRTELTPAVNVAITRGRIVVEQDELLAIEEGRVRESDYDAGEIPELVEALRAEYEARFGEDATAPDDVTEPIVVVQSDRSLDYRTLYVVLRSAATAGFFKYRLATMKS